MLRPARFAGCASYTNLPTFTFDFRVGPDSPPVKLELRPIDYVLKFENDGRHECVTGISPDRDVIWTLGQVFLRSFYSVFDRDLNRIGFARLPRTEFQAINAHQDREAQALLESQGVFWASDNDDADTNTDLDETELDESDDAEEEDDAEDA